ncbi:MAG: carboxy terminal-processing peptidase [Desulfarculaceae bacterium]|nr:carboxy terminal-processing peptidase [Desulfarculaceae bacterium]
MTLLNWKKAAPKNYLTKLLTVLLFFLLQSALPAGAAESGKELSPVRHTDGQAEICTEIVQNIQQQHYTGRPLDDDLSAAIFKQYLSRLDPLKNLFTREDVKRFSRYKYEIDDFLKSGELSFAFDVFNLYLARSLERTRYFYDTSNKWQEKLNFSKNEQIRTDRKDAPWPRDREAMTAFWKKELKNRILSLKLEGNSPQEITETLTKTYKSRLNSIYQITGKDTFETYMNSVAECFDPHTQYFAPKKSENFDIHMSQSLEGIGAVLQSEYQYTKVVRLIPAGPADKSKKLRPGDKIIGVGEGRNGGMKDTVGLRLDNVVKLIRGPKDTFVRLKIIPARKKDSSEIISIKRDKVKLKEQSAKKKVVSFSRNGSDFRLGIIEIPAFYMDFDAYRNGEENYKSTTNDVARLLNELKDEEIDGLIIDLRNNGGGSLKEAQRLTGLFIKSGPVVQIKTKYRVTRLYDDDPAIEYTGPLMVMINRMSASASEIFAGAVKDYNRGIIVGTSSFGKGTVQSLTGLSTGKLKVTSAKFFRVTGESTQKHGIPPDIEYPHIYDTVQIGESSLEGALPYDKTGSAPYNKYPPLDECIDQLNRFYRDMAEEHSGLVYLTEKYKLARKRHKIKSLPLNETRRKEYQARHENLELEIENRYRKSIGKEKLDSVSDIQEHDEDLLLEPTRLLMAEFIHIAGEKDYRW